jgi:hypothetical protein
VDSVLGIKIWWSSMTLTGLQNIGICAKEGVDVKSLTARNILDTILDSFFGVKIDKNGYRYNVKRTREEAKRIEALY